MKRPLVPVALAYAGGILLAHWLELPAIPLLVVALLFVAAAFASKSLRPWILWPLLLLTGWVNLALHTACLSPNDLRRLLGNEAGIVTFRGVLHETPSQRVFERDEMETLRTIARLEVSAIRFKGQDWRAASGRLAISTPGLITNFFAGQIVEITGVANRPRIAPAPG